jgi:hypothetical protein
MQEAELLVGGGDDANARLRKLARFVRPDREAARRGVDDDKTVAPKAMSTLSAPKPATSSGASSRSANEGTFSMLVRRLCHCGTRPSRQ